MQNILFLAIFLIMWFNIHVLTDSLLFTFSYMYYFDNFYPEGDRIINLSDLATPDALVLASTCERVSIALDNIPDSREVEIPVRVIEGMERIMDRGTVSEKQMLLIGSLFDLITQKSFS